MSNDRHLKIEDGTIGSLFRRVTLASIGLESMDDVPEQSFEVIDRADAFAARLLGGVSSVMPKIDSERLGTQATNLAEHIYSGMSGLNGPKNATDLGDWQYWLDAALLMLFDEDEDEEIALQASGKAQKTKAVSRASVRTTPEVIRTQVAALKKSGITPAMLQSMPQQVKRQLVQELKASQNIKAGQDIKAIQDIKVAQELQVQNAAVLAEKMIKALNTAKPGFTTQLAGDASSLEKIFARSSRQNFASHMADKAAQVGSILGQNATKLSANSAVSAETTVLAQKWSDAIHTLSTQSHVEMSTVREMLGALDRLEVLGAVSHEQAMEFRKAGSAYTRHVLMDEIAHDTTAILGRLEKLEAKGQAATNSSASLVSTRAISIDSPLSHDFVKGSLAALTAHLADFNNAVSTRVFTEGESAATLRWSRAADRFTRLQGMSDDVDRVLLRDIVESAASLRDAGIVPASFVSNILKAVPTETQMQRNLSLLQSTEKQELTPIALTQTFNALSGKITELSSLVSAHTSKNGATEAASRWIQTAEKFSQLPTMSDDSARVILKEILEDAQALKNAGIITENAVSELTKRLPETLRQSASRSDARISIAENNSRLLGNMASRIENSVSNLVRDFVKSGATSTGIETFVTDIRQMLSTGNSASSMLASQPQAASVIEAICNRLDEFAQTAAASVSTYGYDDIATEGTYVSVSENSATETENVQNAQSARSLKAIQEKMQNEIRAAQKKADVELRAALNAQKTVNEAIAQAGLKLLDESTANELSAAQIRAMLPMVGESKQQEIKAAAEILEQRQAQLNAFRKQMAVVEDTIKLSTELRKAVSGTSNAVHMDDIRVNSSYLSTLGSSLASYAKVRNSAQSIQNVQFARTESLVQPESRMERMLSLIHPADSKLTPADSKLSVVSASQNRLASSPVFQQLSSTEVTLGYDEVIPASLEWLKAATPEQKAKLAALAEQKALIASSAEQKALIASSAEQKAKLAALAEQKALIAASADQKALIAALAEQKAMIASSADQKAMIASSADQKAMIASSADQKAMIMALAEQRIRLASNGEQHYPATIGSDLTTMLGARKSFEIHAADIASGRTEGFKALADSIQKLASEGTKTAVITSYQTTEDGDRVKVSMTLKPQEAAAQNAFALRQNTGNAYMPAALRNEIKSAVDVAASLNLQNASTRNAVSGADSFMPISAGVNTGTMQAQAQAQGRDAVRMTLSKLGASFTETASQDMPDRFRLTIGGVDFDMSTSAFVQMVAKPAISSASYAAPSLVNADNILFSGYASLLNEHGNQRTLKSLRQAYVDSVARAGQLTAHSEVGFSTQSFANVLGITPEFVAPKATPASARQTAAAPQQEAAFANDLVSKTMPVDATSSLSTDSFAWVSNELRASSARSGIQQISQSAETPQLLNRIDNLLDYVENVSERNVGVFSTDDTVRVLLEAMPVEGSLGNKGLPKWRQKSTPATRMVEARELRDALAKIGATPIQGVQRFANKQYVSPNLIQQQANAAPLFSGGGEGAITPGASANASSAGSAEFDNSSIADEDLQFIAEEVFHKIEESLNEEHQRRRSE
ncbi:MAG: hypothetical protein II180_08680 [Proteobacteria bacterium]|nr:hypothetical protein [Pseudomonadota bacterium]